MRTARGAGGRATGIATPMSPPNWMAYAIIGGVVLASFIAPLIVGTDGLVVPLAVLPFAAIYLVFDRRMRRREQQGRSRWR